MKSSRNWERAVWVRCIEPETRRLDRIVAIKVLPASFSADADRLRRFEQEARSVAALNHPNILAVHDIGTYESAPYMVCELLEGETLRERLLGGVLSSKKAIELAIQIAQGLAAAHDKGIVHRDLKPENIFITKDGRVKILDFGLAKIAHSGSEAQRRRADTHLRARFPDRGRAGSGHRGLHVAGAGARHRGRSSFRHLRVRSDLLRDAERPAGLPAGIRRRRR